MSRDTNFYYSFLVLPAEKRAAIVAVWDFCRAVDDAVDEAVAGASAESEIGRWRREVAACFDGGSPETPQGRAIAPLVRRFNLPRSAFDALVDGVEMDLGSRRYETFDELYEYCTRVASSVGLMCVEIFGYSDPRARQYASRTGSRAPADEYPSRCTGRPVARTFIHPAGGSAAIRLYGRGPPGGSRKLRARCAVCNRQVVARASGAARPRLLRACGRGASGGGRPPPGRRGDHGGDLLRHPDANRSGGLRRVLERDPDIASPSRPDRARHLGTRARTSRLT